MVPPYESITYIHLHDTCVCFFTSPRTVDGGEMERFLQTLRLFRQARQTAGLLQIQ